VLSQRQGDLDQDPEAELQRELERRRLFDDGVIDVLRERLAPEVMDDATVRTWLDRYGPLEPESVADLLDLALPTMGCSQHVQQYLGMVHAALLGGGE
jgi:hypothetical protein